MGEGTLPPTYLNYLAIKVSKLPWWILSTEVVDKLLLHKCTFPLLESNFMKHTCVHVSTHTHTHSPRDTHLPKQLLNPLKKKNWRLEFSLYNEVFLNIASNISISEESPNGFISCREEQFMNHCFHAKVFHSFNWCYQLYWLTFFFFFFKYQNLILA